MRAQPRGFLLPAFAILPRRRSPNQADCAIFHERRLGKYLYFPERSSGRTRECWSPAPPGSRAGAAVGRWSRQVHPAIRTGPGGNVELRPPREWQSIAHRAGSRQAKTASSRDAWRPRERGSELRADLPATLHRAIPCPVEYRPAVLAAWTRTLSHCPHRCPAHYRRMGRKRRPVHRHHQEQQRQVDHRVVKQ